MVKLFREGSELPSAKHEKLFEKTLKKVLTKRDGSDIINKLSARAGGRKLLEN